MSLKTKLLIVLAAVGLIVAGATWGRITAPTKITTIEKLQERDYEAQFSKLEQQIQSMARTLEEVSQKKNIVTNRTVIRLPDGTITEEERTEDKTETNTKTDTTVQTNQQLAFQTQIIKELTLIQEKLHVEERVSGSSPNWLVSVGAGANLPALVGGSVPNLIPGVPAWTTIEASVSRKLILGVYAGVAANNHGDLTLRLTKGF